MASGSPKVLPASLLKPAEKIEITPEDSQIIVDLASKSARVAEATAFSYTRSLPADQMLTNSGQLCAYMWTGAGIGGAIGAGVGLAGGPAIPVTVPTVAVIGAAVGAGVGLGVGSLIIRSQLKRQFVRWRSDQNAQILAEFRRAFQNHDALQICIDIVTQEPMIVPAHCSCTGQQHTLDIETFKNLEARKRACPLADTDADKIKVIRLQDIRVDYRTMGVISIAYVNLLKTGATVSKLSPRLMKGVEILCADLRAHQLFLFTSEKEDVFKKLSSTEDPQTIVMLTERLHTVAALIFASKSGKI